MSKEDNLILFPEVEMLANRITREQFGEMILAVMAYVFRGEEYEGNDISVGICYDVVINQVERGRAVSKERSKAARSRWGKDAQDCKDMHIDANDAPVLSSPDQSSPIQSSPIQSSPDQSKDKKAEDNHCYTKGRVSPGAAAPTPHKKISFGKYGWVKLSRAEYEALEHQLGREELDRCIGYLDESCQKTGNKNRWKDFGLVIRKCADEKWGAGSNGEERRKVPCGASGSLGEAELRNLQRVLKEDRCEFGTP